MDGLDMSQPFPHSPRKKNNTFFGHFGDYFGDYLHYPEPSRLAFKYRISPLFPFPIKACPKSEKTNDSFLRTCAAKGQTN